MKSPESHATRKSPLRSAERRKPRRRREGSETGRNERAAEPYTRSMARWPRYRLRTWLREHLPEPIAYLFPAGSKDCGRHEWFRTDEHTDICWHCTVGEREHVPARIDATSELWHALNEASRAGSVNAKQIVDRMIAEDEEARRLAVSR
jgi:hypothetical protein